MSLVGIGFLPTLFIFGKASLNNEQNATITLGVDVNFTEAGVITVEETTFQNGTWDISYTFKEGTIASNSTIDIGTALKPIATTWIPLIVTLIALAIIIFLVIRSFTGQR